MKKHYVKSNIERSNRKLSFKGINDIVQFVQGAILIFVVTLALLKLTMPSLIAILSVDAGLIISGTIIMVSYQLHDKHIANKNLKKTVSTINNDSIDFNCLKNAEIISISEKKTMGILDEKTISSNRNDYIILKTKKGQITVFGESFREENNSKYRLSDNDTYRFVKLYDKDAQDIIEQNPECVEKVLSKKLR
jgi:hypothetical protein